MIFSISCKSYVRYFFSVKVCTTTFDLFDRLIVHNSCTSLNDVSVKSICLFIDACVR